MKCTKKWLLMLGLLVFSGAGFFAQNIHSDNGDGTYTNPVIPAEVDSNLVAISRDPLVFTGNKFCLLNYATQQLGGYVDFDFLRIE